MKGLKKMSDDQLLLTYWEYCGWEKLNIDNRLFSAKVEALHRELVERNMRKAKTCDEILIGGRK